MADPSQKTADTVMDELHPFHPSKIQNTVHYDENIIWRRRSEVEKDKAKFWSPWTAESVDHEDSEEV